MYKYKYMHLMKNTRDEMPNTHTHIHMFIYMAIWRSYQLYRIGN